MSKSIKEIDELIKSLNIDDEEEIEEASTTAGDPGYMTPNAFTNVDPKKKKKKFEKMAGYSESKYSTFKSIMIDEGTYKDYKRDSTVSNKSKVNLAIKEVSRMMYSIEKIVEQNIKLKTETGVNADSYWKSTHERLNKISERMVKISNKIKNLRQ